VVVIHLASTEPRFKPGRAHQTWNTLNRALNRRVSPLPASSLYAIAAIEEGMPFINFTPSLGADVPAILERAEAGGVPIAGSDGKTGETLLKTVLAPMFRDRHLRIESWVGHNVLGNSDGRILDSSANKAAKLGTKDRVVAELVGYRPETRTSIEYVASLHDWKTAWDHVQFRGFLGTKMTLQFVWQGCDSILAAPLVIDLARLADAHAERGGAGVMTHLACFFKSPMGVSEQGFARQVEMLQRYVSEARVSRKSRR
ncbi:MAG: inositol-3-phosphate synthase, partial [Phycisphaerae bacterium]